MSLKSNIKPIVYGVFNVAVGCGIVFANKAVLSVFNFKFVYALTLVHTIVTMVGMWIFAATGIFEIKRFKALQVWLPLGASLISLFTNLNRPSSPKEEVHVSGLASWPKYLFSTCRLRHWQLPLWGMWCSGI